MNCRSKITSSNHGAVAAGADPAAGGATTPADYFDAAPGGVTAPAKVFRPRPRRGTAPVKFF